MKCTKCFSTVTEKYYEKLPIHVAASCFKRFSYSLNISVLDNLLHSYRLFSRIVFHSLFLDSPVRAYMHTCGLALRLRCFQFSSWIRNLSRETLCESKWIVRLIYSNIRIHWINITHVYIVRKLCSIGKKDFSIGMDNWNFQMYRICTWIMNFL